MNNRQFAPTERLTARSRSALYWALADAVVVAKRQIRQIPRVPDELITAMLQPIIIVLLFRYLFGGAINVPGTSYINYLMAGAFVQSAVFASANTGVGVANDLKRGLIDRFRSLPMAPSAVLTGRIFADLLRNIFVILVTWAIGLLVGFQPAGTFLAWIAASALVLLVSLVFSWLSALVGLLIPSPEAVAQAGIIWLLPFIFASSAFVPVSTMPSWLRAFSEHQPVSLMMDAVRGLLLNQPASSALWQALVWCGGMLLVLIPLDMWVYGRRTAR
ncbi:MAG: Efflux ABC transporter, permease protein [Ktedonobacterales bacterium]|jgi:ABC-2 type transport system permease protein/oleandomycin transport system permease protein|nr:MAG: Efflux ABC transporter, permease protein [Ktedonobacterales bacterium]